MRRAREEREAGRDTDASIEAAAATSGRAVLISGFTVMVAMAGMYLAGLPNFASFATGTIIVVAVAVLGSLTVLPALLSKLGDRVNKGRVPLARPAREQIAAARPLVTHPRPGAPAPAGLGPRGHRAARGPGDPGDCSSLGGIDDTSRDQKVMQTYDRIQAAFPSEGSAEMSWSRPMT